MTITPLDEAKAELDTSEAVADRMRRAERILCDCDELERRRLELRFTQRQLGYIEQPLKTPWAMSATDPKWAASRDNWLAKAQSESKRRWREVALSQIADQLRIVDEQAIYNQPDRLEAQRIWDGYGRAVAAVAWAQGDRSETWLKRWRDLLERRSDLEAIGDERGVRAATAKLDRYTGVEYPRIPAASWSTADLLPEVDRQAEYARLEAKYGPREKPTPANGRRKGRRTP
jgi:hypothetical protein